LKKLLLTIDEISKYGLESEVYIKDKEGDLEQYLVELYSLYFLIQNEHDQQEYPEFDKAQFPQVAENVKKHFPDFGWYHTLLNLTKILEEPRTASGDPIDDLSDIIYDLLEIKWRIQNNSEQDGIWYFKLIFKGHTRDHLLDLLQYLKSKNEED
jgi:hypothetical protein